MGAGLQLTTIMVTMVTDLGHGQLGREKGLT